MRGTKAPDGRWLGLGDVAVVEERESYQTQGRASMPLLRPVAAGGKAVAVVVAVAVAAALAAAAG